MMQINLFNIMQINQRVEASRCLDFSVNLSAVSCVGYIVKRHFEG